MERRNFLRYGSLAGAAIAMPFTNIFGAKHNYRTQEATSQPVVSDREYWVSVFYKIAEPVLRSMSKGELTKNMPLECGPSWDNGRNKAVAYMEAFGRLIAGLAPWIALPDDSTKEGQQRKQLREWTLQSCCHAVDPNSPDYLLWRKESQPLVDAAYIAHAFLRAPKALWEPLDATTKKRFINEFQLLRRVSPPYNNWVLFSAIVEAFLLSIGEQADTYRIDMGIRKTNEWYAGDGWYDDGVHFGFDYYNGYVIHSMMVDTMAVALAHKRVSKEKYDTALKRMKRFSTFLERMISPEGTYPPFGRSITYRIGAFQPLAQLALTKQLPETIAPAQVRSALTAVIRRMFSAEGVFNKEGYLQLGFAGHQPTVADYYSNTGSMYITSLGFLPLGLPADDEFWTAPREEWTSCKAWSGKPFNKDYIVSY